MKHTKGPWDWTIHDYSGATLHGPDDMYDHVITVSPCQSCIDHAKAKNEATWVWGRCTTPKIDDARLLAEAPEMYDRLASARAIMEKFVFKVDTGRARSVETYAEMKQWMEEE